MDSKRLLIIACILTTALAYDPTWLSGDTFYTGVDDVSGGYAGNCGYGDLSRTMGLDHVPYGPMFFAGSPILYEGGAGCGSCYEIQCTDSPACISGSIEITMTDFCPTLGNEVFCQPDHVHFDLSGYAFLNITNNLGVGTTPVLYRRVECSRKGPLVVQIVGNPWWQEFLVMNVPGSGTYDGMKIKATGTDWIPLSRDWGANFISNIQLKGDISVMISDSYSGVDTYMMNCVPADWKSNSLYVCESSTGNVPTSPSSTPVPTYTLPLQTPTPSLSTQPVQSSAPTPTGAPSPVSTPPSSPPPCNSDRMSAPAPAIVSQSAPAPFSAQSPEMTCSMQNGSSFKCICTFEDR